MYKELFEKAKRGKYAIGQFNISTAEQLKAAAEISHELKAPIIIGASENERAHLGDHQAVALVNAWSKELGYPIILNADHCKTYDSAIKAFEAGFTAIHFDGSELDIEKNIEITQSIVKKIKNINSDIVIEGELGYLRGSSEIHSKKTEIKESDLTNPDQGLEFYQKTEVDNLAIVIGNMHGIESDMKNPNLNINRLNKIKDLIPHGKFVLHGGSGTPLEDIKAAIKNGVIKVNINTELRMAFSNSLKRYLNDNPNEIKPYHILAPVIEETRNIIAEKIKLFGSDNKI